MKLRKNIVHIKRIMYTDNKKGVEHYTNICSGVPVIKRGAITVLG